MKVLCIVGPSDSGKTSVVESLTERLADQGTVSTIKHLTHEPDIDRDGKDTARHRAAGATATVGMTDEDGWFATGAVASLESALERLAPSADYVVVEGYSESKLPKVALGDASPAEPVVASAPNATAVDIPSLVSTIEETEPIETVSSLITRVEEGVNAESEGTIATFTGDVSNLNLSGDVRTGSRESRENGSMAERRIASIVRDLRGRDRVRAVGFHHRRSGVSTKGGTVHLVVDATDRSVAFTTVADGIDRLEAELPALETGMTIEGKSVRTQNSDG